MKRVEPKVDVRVTVKIAFVPEASLTAHVGVSFKNGTSNLKLSRRPKKKGREVSKIGVIARFAPVSVPIRVSFAVRSSLQGESRQPHQLAMPKALMHPMPKHGPTPTVLSSLRGIISMNGNQERGRGLG
jgi:hypothetical protein